MFRAKTPWWVNEDTEKQRVPVRKEGNQERAHLEDEQEVFQEGGILYSSHLGQRHTALIHVFWGELIY